MELISEGFERNRWIAQNKIPLGTSATYGTTVFKLLPRLSDTVICGAMPGRGKSVLARLLYFYISRVRPIIVFDWEGEDHKHSYYPNDVYTNPPPFTSASGIKGVYYNYTDEKESFEDRACPNLMNYNFDELRGLGFPLGASMKLAEILEKYPDKFKSIPELKLFIDSFPSNDNDIIRTMKRYDAMGEDYPFEKNDTIPSQTKQSMQKYIYSIMTKNLFSLDNKRVPLFTKLIQNRINIFLNFGGFVDIARVEIAKIVEDVIKYRKKMPDAPAPYFFYEEADRITPRNLDDQEEKKKIQYVSSSLVEASKRARKQKIGQCYITPALSNLNKTIVDISFEYIFGEMRGFDLAEVKRVTDEYTANTVKSLKFNRYRNIREFLFRDEFKINRKFIPYECSQGMHRE